MECSLSLYKLTEPHKSFSNFHKLPYLNFLTSFGQIKVLFSVRLHYFNEVWLHVFNGAGFLQKQMNSSRRQYTVDITLNLPKRNFPPGLFKLFLSGGN